MTVIRRREWLRRATTGIHLRQRLRGHNRPSPSGSGSERKTSAKPITGAERPTTTVLVVDDDPAVRRMFTRMLSEAGFDVLEASNGLEALERCAREDIAVVVTDLKMPRMGGDELARRIMGQWPGVRLVFVTAYPEARAASLPGQLLLKPFPPEDLVATVRGLADRYWVARRREDPEASEGPKADEIP
jgi:CheY-like chemotaxis protein